jgi:hypothetical protein
MKSLSTQKKSLKKKYILICLLCVLLVGCVTGIYSYNKNNDQTLKDKQDTFSHKQKADEIKRDSPKVSQDNTAGLPQNSTSITPDKVQTSSSLSVVISSVLQENGKVTTIAQVNGSGTCVFEYTTSGDKPVINQVSVNGTTCESSVPEVQFAKLGVWNLKVTYYNNEMKAEAQQDVTIR